MITAIDLFGRPVESAEELNQLDAARKTVVNIFDDREKYGISKMITLEEVERDVILRLRKYLEKEGKHAKNRARTTR